MDIIPYQCKLIATKSPIPVYTRAVEALPHGIKIMMSEQERLGVHCIVSGKVLASLRDTGLTSKMLYDHFAKLGGKFSRVDIALDIVEENNLEVSDFLREMKSVKTALSGYKYIASSESVETIYVGNMKSKSRKLRIYDKGVESGLPIRWVRVEYEKRRGANNLIDKIIGDDLSIAGVIKSVIDFPDWQDWQNVVGENVDEITRGEAVQTAKSWQASLEWLCSSAAPALANAIYEERKSKVLDKEFSKENSVVINTFISALNAELAEKFHTLESME